ncbi:MAG TPA: hypothetical protein DCM67_11680 [Propionibacteriaceae bacterium]|nr:hypothetical protein [Propionibacteriaceae bacterium]
MSRLTSLALLTVTGTALILAGCSGPPQAAPTFTPTSAIPTALPTVAERTASIQGSSVIIAVRELRVADAVMTLTWSATVVSADFWYPGRSFEGRYDDDKTTTQNWYTTSGVSVIDPAHAQRYLPALTTEGHCVCSSTPVTFGIRAGQTGYFSAVYQAVPEGVATVSIDIPHTGTFTDIPVQR